MLGIQLRLHPREKTFPCDKDFNIIPNFFPCYYTVKDYAYMGKKYRGVFYEIYYQFNYAIGLFGVKPTDEAFGYHPKDKERIVVLHDYETNEPLFVFMSGHAQEGRWVSFKECKLTQDGGLIMYAALSSHRHYHKPAILWRMFGFANDVTSDKGRHIDMNLLEDNTINPRNQNKEVMDTTFRSFFLPLYVSYMQQMADKSVEEQEKINKDVL